MQAGPSRICRGLRPANAPRYLNNGQTLIVGGACDSTERDQAWSTTENAVEQPEPCYFSNAEEADTRVWLHASTPMDKES